MAKATNQEAGLNDQQSPKDSDAPSRMVSTESLGSRADHIEQAVAILKRAHLAFTAALRYPELESNASLGCRPRSPQQNLQAFKDLEEDLVLQASAEVETLTREEWFEDIEINSTGCPPQRQEQVCCDKGFPRKVRLTSQRTMSGYRLEVLGSTSDTCSEAKIHCLK